MYNAAKPRVVALGGPTATGKTALSVALAKRFGGEIISADSMQIYQGLDVGTAKVTPEEMQDRDIVEFTDDSGNTLMLEVMDYFYYNGQEFAALCDAQENPSDDEPDDDPVYIMQVNTFEDENGEEMEEFVPPEEALMEKLIQIVRTRFTDEEDGDDEE